MTDAPTDVVNNGDLDRERLARAIELSAINVRVAGGGPFGAMIVLADGTTFVGVNRSAADMDPTRHGEVSALTASLQAYPRDAPHAAFPGATLYSSCQPCAMCLGAAQLIGIERIVFAATSEDAEVDAGFSGDPATYRIQEGLARLAMSGWIPGRPLTIALTKEGAGPMTSGVSLEDAPAWARAYGNDTQAGALDRAWVVDLNGNVVAQSTPAAGPLEHAAVEAIRAAARARNSFDLGGPRLITTCPPCPFCISSAYWAGISAVAVLGGRALDGGMNPVPLWRHAVARGTELTQVVQVPGLRDEARAVLREWKAAVDAGSRVNYQPGVGPSTG